MKARELSIAVGQLELAWTYLLYLVCGMAHMEVGAAMAIMPRMASWQSMDLALVFAMWAIMMIAMMLPSAAPMMLLFAALSQKLVCAEPATLPCPRLQPDSGCFAPLPTQGPAIRRRLQRRPVSRQPRDRQSRR
jgi:hypothetical protein